MSARPIGDIIKPYDERRAADAYEVHRMLLLMETFRPALKGNPHWRCLRMDAFEAFCNAFEVKQ